MSGHLLSHSNSFGFEMEKDAAGCRALNRNFIVGGEHNMKNSKNSQNNKAQNNKGQNKMENNAENCRHDG